MSFSFPDQPICVISAPRINSAISIEISILYIAGIFRAIASGRYLLPGACCGFGVRNFGLCCFFCCHFDFNKISLICK